MVNPKWSWKFKFVGIIGLGKVINARLQKRPTFIIYLTKTSPLRLEAIFRKLRLGPMFEQFEMQVANGKKGHRERCVDVALRLLRGSWYVQHVPRSGPQPLTCHLRQLWKWGFFLRRWLRGQALKHPLCGIRQWGLEFTKHGLRKVAGFGWWEEKAPRDLSLRGLPCFFFADLRSCPKPVNFFFMILP